jgi:hypothetical protein
MIVFPYRILSCAAVLACGVASAAVPAAAAPRAPDDYSLIQRQPMIFFVARGQPNACGPACSEWIAAEGAIDPDAAKRLLDFLAALPRRDLPIFFNSAGGIARQAVALGAILREQRMTAGVGRTLPDGCRNIIDDACRRVMQSKSEHRARLVTAGARCFSACVYALVGASVRRVARDAQLGIHSVRVIPIPGREPRGPAPKVDDFHGLLKRYFIEMGVDPGLIDAAAKVSANTVRYMSRDEIGRFGVEVWDIYETPWMAYQDGSNQYFVLKSITQTGGAGGREQRTSSIRMWCIGGGMGIWLVYQRELPSNEIGTAAVIRLAADDSEYVLKDGRGTAGSAQRSTSIAQEVLRQFVVSVRAPSYGREERSASASLEFLRNAIAAPSIVITESLTPQADGSSSSRVVKFSTNGLSKALEPLQKNCGEAKLQDAPAVKFIDAPGVRGSR